MNILFVSDFLFTPYGGAQKSAQAHIESLVRIVGEDNVDVAAINMSGSDTSDKYVSLPGINGKLSCIYNMIIGNTCVINEKANRIVYEMLDKKEYDVLFIDNSWFGKICRYARKKYPNIRIITNFHGVKYNSRLQNIILRPTRIINYLDFISAVHNERIITKLSDKVLLLNQRENMMLQKYYHRAADLILPVYFVDSRNKNVLEDNGKFNILFVGGALKANHHGIEWFIRNVVPHLNRNIELYVVGNTMDKLNDDPKLDKRIKAVGRVDDLGQYYNSANIAIGPIFEGDGMKTKTAEALMYGKVFVGTDESLMGYEGLDEYRCNTPEEFINTINKLVDDNIPKYSQKMRNIFEKHHSVEMADSIFRKALGI